MEEFIKMEIFEEHPITCEIGTITDQTMDDLYKSEQDLSCCQMQNAALLKNLEVVQAERESVAIRCSKLEQAAVKKPKTTSVRVGTEETMVMLENTQYKLTETERKHQSLIKQYQVLKSQNDKLTASNSKLYQHARKADRRLRQFKSDVKVDVSRVATDLSSTLIGFDEVLKRERDVPKNNRNKRHRLKKVKKAIQELTGLVKEIKRKRHVTSDEWRQIQTYVGQLGDDMECVVKLTTSENDSGAAGPITSNNDTHIKEIEYLRTEVDRLREQIKKIGRTSNYDATTISNDQRRHVGNNKKIGQNSGGFAAEKSSR